MEWDIDGDFVVHRASGYDINVSRFHTKAEFEETIMHVGQKEWATTETLEQLSRRMLFMRHKVASDEEAAMFVKRAVLVRNKSNSEFGGPFSSFGVLGEED